MTERIYEGTWEEVSGHAEEFAGRRVKLIVVSEESEKDGRTLDQALAGLIGKIDSGDRDGGMSSHLSEDETSFGEYLEQKHREGRL